MLKIFYFCLYLCVFELLIVHKNYFPTRLTCSETFLFTEGKLPCMGPVWTLHSPGHTFISGWYFPEYSCVLSSYSNLLIVFSFFFSPPCFYTLIWSLFFYLIYFFDSQRNWTQTLYLYSIYTKKKQENNKQKRKTNKQAKACKLLPTTRNWNCRLKDPWNLSKSVLF